MDIEVVEVASKDIKEEEIDITEYMETLRQKVDDRIDYIIERYDFLEFLEPIRYTMTGTKGGKKIRPTLATLMCQALGGKNDDKTLEVSVIVELMHQGSLVLDDMLDGDAERRGEKALWIVEQVAGTAVSGLIMFMVAQKIGAHRVPKARDLVMETIEMLAKGNSIDMKGLGWDETKYIDMIYKKTAFLYGASGKFGAIMADANDVTLNKAFEYGKNIGMMYQVIDDLTDILKTRKMSAMIGDMRRGKVTLAMIDMYNKDKKYRGTLDRYAERKVTPDELPAFFKVMDKCGSINYVKDTAETYVNSAVSAISSFPDNKYTRALRKLPDYMRDALMAEVQ